MYTLRTLSRPLRTSTRISTLPIRNLSYRPTPTLLARKDAQGKDDLKPESNEYSKSGSDDAAAATEDTAFNPNKTSPEEEHDAAGEESKKASNPLDVSPANHDVSQPRGGQEGGHEGSASESGQSSGRERTSGGGSPKKSGK
ncbi:hypothetical protein M8818_007010 [Zalaria obscura]|uniref:Uncharacterized protein n=1 Tax=Zalaria obscura TaxID=2024903 RepID=A0ACC3S6S6_9PEZI